MGFVQFSGVAPGGIADWGFYAAPEARKGSGSKLGVAALGFAFETLGLHKVCGQALDFNEASIRFHLRLGFQQEGVLREQKRIGGKYHDLICFGLLCHDAAAKRTTSTGSVEMKEVAIAGRRIGAGRTAVHHCRTFRQP